MLVTLLGIVTEVKPEQSEKAWPPMLSTLLGIVTEVKPEQFEKAKSPTLVTLLPIVTDFKPEQLEKALSPMLVTLLGIVTEVKPVQPYKAYLPMLVTLLGITVVLHPIINVFDDVSMIALHPSLLSYVVLPSLTFIFVKPLQPVKADSPMLVTLLGIVTEVKPEQSLYLQPIITQYFIDNKSEIWLLFLIAHSKR